MADEITLPNADLGVLNYLGVDEVVAWARELEEAT
jgi:hypothetical protein